MRRGGRRRGGGGERRRRRVLKVAVATHRLRALNQSGGRHAKHLDKLSHLVELVDAREEWLASVHLDEDAA